MTKCLVTRQLTYLFSSSQFMNESTSTSWKDEDLLMKAFFDERIKTSNIRDFSKRSINDFSFAENTVRSIADDSKNSKKSSLDWRRRSWFFILNSRKYVSRRVISFCSAFCVFRTSSWVVWSLICSWRTRFVFFRRARSFFNWRADERLERKTKSTLKRKTESTLKRKTESTLKRKAESTLKRRAESTLKRKAESTLKRRAESTLKRKAESTLKRKTESTRERRAESTLKRKTRSTLKRRTDEMLDT